MERWPKSNGASPLPEDAGAPSLLAVLSSALLWTLIGLLTVLFSLAIMAGFVGLCAVDRQRRVLHWLASLWGRAVFRCSPSWRVTITGLRHIDPRRASVLVANHQSLLDIMALFALRRQFKWIAKEELFRIPFLGWAMALAGYVKLSRGRHGSIRESYEQARRWLASGMSVLFFPEGTRSATGEMGAFKLGAFKLAVETGVPIVPIAVSGTRNLLMRGSWLFRHGCRVQISVLPPLDPAAYRAAADPRRLCDDVRQLIQRALQQ